MLKFRERCICVIVEENQEQLLSRRGDGAQIWLIRNPTLNTQQYNNSAAQKCTADNRPLKTI